NSIDEGFCIYELLYDDVGKPVDLRWVEVNPAYEKHTGLKDTVGKLASEVMPGTENYWLEIYDKVVKTGEAVRFENWHEPTGRWYYTFASRIGSAGSNQVAVVFSDITERKQVEEALRESEERKAFLLMLSDALRPLNDALAIEETITRLAMDFFGSDRCYYCQIEADQAVIKRDAAREGLPSVAGVYPMSTLPIFKAVVDSGKPFVVHDVNSSNLVDEPLRQLCLQLQVISFIDIPVIKNGIPLGVLCVVQSTPRHWTALEIELAEETAERTWAAVERAKAEEALNESEKRFRNLIESYAQAVWETNATGQVVTDSPSWRAYTGQTIDEWLDYGWVNAIHPDDRAYAERQWREAIASKSLVDASFRLKHAASGGYRWTNVRATPILNEDDNVTK
ncbi:MAG: PAS domain S-box protein, partial [Pontibacter sp.]|nr:PAS domain S-box protein [Pontibacter sp.]